MTKNEIKKKAEEYAKRLEAEDAEARRAEAGKERPRYNLLHPASMTKQQQKYLYTSVVLVVLFFTIFLAVTCTMLIKDKSSEISVWNEYEADLDEETLALIDKYGKDATEVEVAIDVEEIRSIDFKNSNYVICMNVAYMWEGHDDWDFSDASFVRFDRGDIEDSNLIVDYRGGKDKIKSEASEIDERIAASGKNYQKVYYEATITKDYKTVRFPLGSHQLRFFLTPSINIDQIKFKVNSDECFMNDDMKIRGYDIVNYGVNEYVSVTDKHLLNPVYDSYSNGDDNIYTMQVMGQIEINADGLGTYIKCFIALFGTLAWIVMCLYICSYRKVDSLSLTGSAFFGAVSIIVVSASLLPDALHMGLVEYVNIFGIAIIIAAATTIIRVNNFRNEHGKVIFAHFYGKTMLWTFIAIILIGNILLPLSAWNIF